MIIITCIIIIIVIILSHRKSTSFDLFQPRFNRHL